MKRGRAEEIVREVRDAVLQWNNFADEAGVPEEIAKSIEGAHRANIL